MSKLALITGVNGQDGSYLAELLLKLEYKVVGLKRRHSSNNLWRLKDVLGNPNFTLVEGDVSDSHSMHNIVTKLVENHCGELEIYNLAAQSHVHTSFEQPAYTFAANFNGVLNILEAMLPYKDYIRFYQASTSEMFGDNKTTRWTDYNEPVIHNYQDENTPFSPMSPYAVAKLAAHNLVNNYRKAYGLHASCGILFNHEGPRRGEEFLTQKVCNYVARLKKHMEIPHPIIPNRPEFPKLKLGNLYSYRDFGFAGDYVKAMWLMLQQETPDDYVIATGETTQIHDYVIKAFKYIGENWEMWVDIDKSLIRPSEVDYLLGDASKARLKLGWAPSVDLDGLIKMTVDDAYAKL
jgi:GDPmannose 4,6-dehydratase